MTHRLLFKASKGKGDFFYSNILIVYTSRIKSAVLPASLLLVLPTANIAYTVSVYLSVHQHKYNKYVAIYLEQVDLG